MLGLTAFVIAERVRLCWKGRTGDMGGVDEVELRKMAVDGREVDSRLRNEGLLGRGLTEESSKQLIVAESSNDLIGSECRSECDGSEKDCLPLTWMGMIGTATAVSTGVSNVISPSSDRSTSESFNPPARRILSSLEKCCLRIFSGSDKNHWASASETRDSVQVDWGLFRRDFGMRYEPFGGCLRLLECDESERGTKVGSTTTCAACWIFSRSSGEKHFLLNTRLVSLTRQRNV